MDKGIAGGKVTKVRREYTEEIVEHRDGTNKKRTEVVEVEIKPNNGFCTILTLNKIEYDNPILNYPILLNQMVEKFGSNIIRELIDFGMQFTITPEHRDLLNSICNEQNNVEAISMLMGLDNNESADTE